MDHRRAWTNSPYLVALLGIALSLAAVAHHAAEVAALDGTVWPLVAFLLDAIPAVALAGVGLWLARTGLGPEDRRTVALWCLAGAGLFGAALGATFLVRVAEGRTVTEPMFPLLVAVEAGGLAGATAGYYNAKSRMAVRQERTITDAFAFVNELIRHDIRNDLAVIQGHASEVDDGEVIAEKSEESLRRIETTDAIAETLVGDPTLEPVDLAGLAAEMARKVEDTHRVSVTTDLPEHAPVTGNAGLRSVVDNVLENAAEHNDADDPRVEVSVDAGPKVVRLVVRDNGPGIPDERKETVLESGGGRSEGGGLSLVRTLVEGYGGRVRIADNDPRGAIVVVELPRASGA